MTPTRTLNRRSFFASVAGGGLVLAAGSGAAQKPARGLYDCDSGANADGTGGGGGPPRGTDADSGPRADAPCNGRSTDRDRGANADPVGRGRRAGCTDSDSGPGADPAGAGRACRRR